MEPISRIRKAGLLVAVASVAAAPRSNAQEQLWFAESTVSNDSFGATSIGPDLDADGRPELLVSAPGATCTNPVDGLARIYSIASGQLRQWCGTGGWSFGAPSLWIDDIDGGGTRDVMIGERWYYDSVTFGSDTGRFQVYSGESGALIYEVIGTQFNGQFGFPATVVDDYDGDGFCDLLIGGAAYGSNSEGRAWVFSAKSGAVIRTHNSSQSYGRFGTNVHALRDVDGDGVNDYAVYAQHNVFSDGRLHVYSGASGSLLLKMYASYGSDHFGYAVAGVGDLSGDGIDDFLVGGVGQEGHVDAYSAVTGKRLWRIDGAVTGEWFGSHLQALSDLNGDGFDEFLVTALYDDHEGRYAGRVDLISGRTHRALFRFYSGIDGLDEYGRVLNAGADFNLDGLEDLIIGSQLGGTSKSKGGHVAIYAGNDLWLQADPLDPTSAETVTIDLRGAEPGRLGLLALVAVDGTPLFEPLVVAPFDANGELQLLADADPSLSGLDFTLLGYAENRRGRGPLMISSAQTVAVQ